MPLLSTQPKPNADLNYLLKTISELSSSTFTVLSVPNSQLFGLGYLMSDHEHDAIFVYVGVNAACGGKYRAAIHSFQPGGHRSRCG